eukprot:TRINITY_DN8049_c0_g1_i2.p1 TRINITY_DN8049_c0_g1~~TRINITY_DN8049_c0_g1_i2.p1  ORF type:complete len:516 (+),score=138.69 TRINITY_DN8049_c0_g1_i2:43-1548(+)
MAEPYAPVRAKQFPRVAQLETAEERYWSKLKFPTVHKDSSAAVTCIDFSPTAPYNYAVTAGQKITIYDSQTHQPKKNLTRFKATATSGRYRHDGKLIVAGDHSGLIQVIDVNGKATLRRFEEHKKAVHAVSFASQQDNRVVSGGDDATVRLWDVSMETAITTFTGHDDYVRACRPCPSSNLIVSGSYDHSAKVWDPNSPQAVFEVNHGSPIEAVAVFHNGTAFATAGENVIKIWDLVAGGKLLNTVSNHQKTITDLQFDQSGRHLFSAGLDRLLKVYSVNTWQVLHSYKYANPLLCLAVAHGDQHLAAGMTTGLADVRSRANADIKSRPAPVQRARRPGKPGTYRFLIRGQNTKPSAKDVLVAAPKRKKLRKHDQLLKKFRYGQALDAVLDGAHRHAMVASVLQELVERDGLRTALSGRDDVTLQPILRFCLKTLGQPRYTKLIVMVTELLLDIYSGSLGLSPVVDELFQRLAGRLNEEVLLQKEMCGLLGNLELLLSAAA